MEPHDCRIYNDLLGVAKAQNWKLEDINKVFNQSFSIDPDYSPTFNQRYDMAKEKWFGGEGDAAAFAAKWGGIQPRLKVEAVKAEGEEGAGAYDDEYFRKMGTPALWPRYLKAKEEFFQWINLDYFQEWTIFAWISAKTDKVKDFLEFLRAQSQKDEILKDFEPYLTCLVYDYRAQVIGWNHAGQLYLNSKEVWPDYYKATMQAVRQDPDNYTFMNYQVRAFAGWGRFRVARDLYNVIGDHWVPKCGTQQDFEKFKRVAFLKEAPSWHLCLSPEEQRSER